MFGKKSLSDVVQLMAVLLAAAAVVSNASTTVTETTVTSETTQTTASETTQTTAGETVTGPTAGETSTVPAAASGSVGTMTTAEAVTQPSNPAGQQTGTTGSTTTGSTMTTRDTATTEPPQTSAPITTATPAPTTTAAPPIPEYTPPDLTKAKPFNMTFVLHLMDEQWLDDLDDPTSDRYKSLAFEVETLVNEAFLECPGFRKNSSRVLDFFLGSVKTSYSVSFYADQVYTDSDATLDYIVNSVIGLLNGSTIFGNSSVEPINMKQDAANQVNVFVNQDPCAVMTSSICESCYVCKNPDEATNLNLTCNYACDMDSRRCLITDYSGDVAQTTCVCKENYVDVGGDCVDETLLIGVSAGVAGAVLLILIIIIVVLCCKLGDKNKENNALKNQTTTTTTAGPSAYEPLKLEDAGQGTSATANGTQGTGNQEAMQLTTFTTVEEKPTGPTTATTAAAAAAGSQAPGQAQPAKPAAPVAGTANGQTPAAANGQTPAAANGQTPAVAAQGGAPASQQATTAGPTQYIPPADYDSPSQPAAAAGSTAAVAASKQPQQKNDSADYDDNQGNFSENLSYVDPYLEYVIKRPTLQMLVDPEFIDNMETF